MPLTVTCPTCGQAHPWSTDNPYRPFCSARCKQVDLGAWASDSYRIAGETGEDMTDDRLPAEARQQRAD